MYKWSVVLAVGFLVGYGIARHTSPLFYIPEVSADTGTEDPVQGPPTKDHIPMPEGCKRLLLDEGVKSKWSSRRIFQSIFVRCYIGQHAYIAVVSPKGVKISQPVNVD